MQSTNSLPFFQNIKYVLVDNFLNFSDRANRGEYWKFFVFQFTLYLIIGLALVIFAPQYTDEIDLIVQILFFIPQLSLNVRRLHDINKTGWWVLIGFVPFIGFLVLLYFFIKKGDPDTNKYGPVPLYDHQ